MLGCRYASLLIRLNVFHQTVKAREAMNKTTRKPRITTRDMLYDIFSGKQGQWTCEGIWYATVDDDFYGFSYVCCEDDRCGHNRSEIFFSMHKLAQYLLSDYHHER